MKDAADNVLLVGDTVKYVGMEEEDRGRIFTVRAVADSFPTDRLPRVRVDDGDPGNHDLHTNNFKMSSWLSGDEVVKISAKTP